VYSIKFVCSAKPSQDRCAYVPKAQQAAVQAAQAQAAAAISSQHAQMPGSPFVPFSPMTPSFASFGSPAPFGSPLFPAVAAGYMDPAAADQAGNRNIYLGNLGPKTTTEELCNNIRGGMLQQIRHMHDKNIAVSSPFWLPPTSHENFKFVTFFDPTCALNFFHHATATNLTINSRRLKIGWGKHSGPVSQTVMQAVQAGASRNIYIGSISDFTMFNENKLKQDFGEYGGPF